MTTSSHSATLKGKINALEEIVKELDEELAYYKKETLTLRQEKEALDSDLNNQIGNIKKNLL
jgi:chromosome segregation ATPase